MNLSLPIYMWSTPWKVAAALVWVFGSLVLVIAAVELLRSWRALNGVSTSMFGSNDSPFLPGGGFSWMGSLRYLGGALCLALFLEVRGEGSGQTWHDRLVQFAWFLGLGVAILFPIWLAVSWIKYVRTPTSPRSAYNRVIVSGLVVLLIICASVLWIQRPLAGG